MCIKHQVQELLLTQINMGHLGSIAVLIVNSYNVIQENVCCIRVPAENIVPPGPKKKKCLKRSMSVQHFSSYLKRTVQFLYFSF